MGLFSWAVLFYDENGVQKSNRELYKIKNPEKKKESKAAEAVQNQQNNQTS